jgi:hypothetical protein
MPPLPIENETCGAYNKARRVPCRYQAIGFHLELDIPLCRFHFSSRSRTILTAQQGIAMQPYQSESDTTTTEQSEEEQSEEEQSEEEQSEDSSIDSPELSTESNSSRSTTTVADGDHPMCAICQSALSGSKRNVTELSPCLHRFHTRCAGRWQSVNPTCPICRTEIEDFNTVVVADDDQSRLSFVFYPGLDTGYYTFVE